MAVEKISLRDLSSTTVKSCGKGRDRILSASSGHGCHNCEKSHLLPQPPASPYTPSRSEATSGSQRSRSVLPASVIAWLHPLHGGCGHVVGEAVAVVSSSFPPKTYPMVLSPPSRQRWNSFDSCVSLLRALNQNENILSCFLGYISTDNCFERAHCRVLRRDYAGTKRGLDCRGCERDRATATLG